MSDENGVRPGNTSVDVGVVARLGAKVRGLKDQLKSVAAERDDLKGKLASLSTEADQLRQRADTSAVGAELDRLRQELRTNKHRQEFDRLALAKGLKKEALADAWELAKVKVEADEPDAAALGLVLDEQAKARPYLFGGQGETATTSTTATEPAKPGPASGQGGGAKSPGAPVFTEAQKSDPGYIMKNWESYVAATKSSLDAANAAG